MVSRVRGKEILDFDDTTTFCSLSELTDSIVRFQCMGTDGLLLMGSYADPSNH